MAITKISKHLPTIRRIADLTGLSEFGEPQWSYMWEVQMLRAPISSFTGMMFYAKTCTIPDRQAVITTTRFLGQHIKHLVHDDSEKSITISFIDDESLTVTRYFNQWYDLCLTNPKSSVSGDLQIKLKDSTDMLNTGVFTFTGCIIQSISEIQLDMSSNEPITFDVVLRFDDMNLNDSQEIGNIGDVIRGVFE